VLRTTDYITPAKLTKTTTKPRRCGNTASAQAMTG